MTTDLFALARQTMLAEREKAMVRLDTAAGQVEAAQQEHAIALAEVNVWTKALAALGEAPAAEPVKRERMDIAEAVLAELGNGRPGAMNIAALVASLDRKPGQIRSAIDRLIKAGRVEKAPGFQDTYQLAPVAAQREAAE